MAKSKNQNKHKEPKKRGPKPGCEQRGGTPKKEVIFDDPKNVKKLHKYACNFLTNDQMAACFGMGKTAFYNILNTRPQLRLLIEQGKSESINAAAKGVVKAAKEGSRADQMFILRCHGGWTDKHELVVSGGVDINIELETVKRIDQLSPEQRALRLKELTQLDITNTEVIDVEFDEA